jgi:hypothetical protein
MAPIVSEVDVARPPEEVFRYATHPARFGEWHGPVRADVAVIVDPSQDGTQAHVTIEVDFRGSGMGKLILPMVLREARKEVPQSCQQLKFRLESGLAAPAEP